MILLPHLAFPGREGDGIDRSEATGDEVYGEASMAVPAAGRPFSVRHQLRGS